MYGLLMIKSLNHITLAVTDIERSFDFYRNVLGLTPLCKWDKGAYFLAGEVWFSLNVDPLRTQTLNGQVAMPDYTHYAFSITEQDFDMVKLKLIDAGAREFHQNQSHGKSFYFLDPDGHKLEIHVGDWKMRMAALRDKPGITFYDKE